MHIPDGLFPFGQAMMYWAIALFFIWLSLRWARNEMSEDKIPLIAVLAAGIFTIQYFNVPMPVGISGHVIGAALCAVVLGSPYAAVFILTLVILVQGFLFNDGGITIMGANILNMGAIGGFVGFYSFRGFCHLTGDRRIPLFLAAWLACLVPALACGYEILLTGLFSTTPGVLLGVIGLYHALIGILEGGVTVFALHLISMARPDVIPFGDRIPQEAGLHG